MRLTPNQARDMIAKELTKGNGIYIDGRYFEVRVKAGVLEVSDFNSWFPVAPGSVFRNVHGRDLFKYEPPVIEAPVMVLATLPFSGFYDSLHDAEIDQAMEQMFSDTETGCHRNEGLESALFNKCNFGAVHNAYAVGYAEAFADEFKIQGLKFESLKSPKEYNFSTDVIFVHVPASEVVRILAATDGKALADLVAEKFTSRSGFMSFYSPDLEDWGPVEEWDHNQVGTLLEAYANQESSDDFDSSAEVALMEKARSNGNIDGWIESATPGIERLYKVHDYLNARMARGSN